MYWNWRDQYEACPSFAVSLSGLSIPHNQHLVRGRYCLGQDSKWEDATNMTQWLRFKMSNVHLKQGCKVVKKTMTGISYPKQIKINSHVICNSPFQVFFGTAHENRVLESLKLLEKVHRCCLWVDGMIKLTIHLCCSRHHSSKMVSVEVEIHAN